MIQAHQSVEHGLDHSLSEQLRSETRLLHTQAERSAFMGVLLRGEMQRADYCAMLRNLHAIYAELEPALHRHATDPVLMPLHAPALWRTAALALDLETLHGPGWQASFPLKPATLHYVARLAEIDLARPSLLAAHSYVRYLGDLSGGQMLGRIVRKSLRLGDDGGGIAFYDFGGAVEVAQRKHAFRKGLDAIVVDDASADDLVAEAKLAFELHRQLFDELARDLQLPGRSR